MIRKPSVGSNGSNLSWTGVKYTPNVNLPHLIPIEYWDGRTTEVKRQKVARRGWVLYFSRDVPKKLRSWLEEKYARWSELHLYALGIEEPSTDKLEKTLKEGLGVSFPEELVCWRTQWELKCVSLLRWHITEGMRTEALQTIRAAFFDRVDKHIIVGQSRLSLKMVGAAFKREHVVPCNMLTSKAMEMMDDGVGDSVVARFIKDHCLIVKLLTFEQEHVDVLHRRDMTVGWNWGMDPFARMTLAGIEWEPNDRLKDLHGSGRQ